MGPNRVSDALNPRLSIFPASYPSNEVAIKERQNDQFKEGYERTTRNLAIPLHRFIAVALRGVLRRERSASHSKYCSGPRRLGRWFWLERCLRHSRQGWLQRQHRPRARDVL